MLQIFKATKLLSVTVCGLLLFLVSSAKDSVHTRDRMIKNLFPKEFLWGCATASYQVEGGWNLDGKGENIWDYLTHTNPSVVANQDNGDVADDSYHKYKEDVALLKDMGFQVYRFSISWSRILPSGEANVINEKGIQYYKNLINELLSQNIEPMVTLYHWDLPQPLQEFGGWANPIMADFFEDFVDVVFRHFGDKVKFWITINEPWEIVKGYSDKKYAPYLNLIGGGDYLVNHNLLRAHAKAYRLYQRKYKDVQKGKVGITLNSQFYYPLNKSSKEDVEAAERSLQFILGWCAHPIFSKTGDYPPIMRYIVDQNSAKEGRTRSRLPRFTEQEIIDLKGSSDFFGLNHYTSSLTSSNVTNTTFRQPSVLSDNAAAFSSDPNWPASKSTWLNVVPEGFRDVLKWIKKEYDNPEIFVTENGFSDSGHLNDDGRIDYYSKYLNSLLKAIHNDKVNVIGYTAWSLLDNFEWMDGYSSHFGIVKVNFTSPDRTRLPKKSSQWWKTFLNSDFK